MKKTALTLLTLVTVGGFVSPAAAWNQPPTSSSSTSTSVPPTTSSVPTSSSTTESPAPSSTTSTAPTTTVAETTTTSTGPSTTVQVCIFPDNRCSLDTVPNPFITVAPTTTIPETTTVLDAVELIPPVTITSQDRLPETGFPYWNVAIFGVGVLCLGFAGELIRKMAVQK